MIDIALIAQYATLAKSLGLDKPQVPPTFADYARANALATQCMIELPNDVWQKVIDAVMSPNWGGIFELIRDLRAGVHPDKPLDDLQYVIHAPVIGAKGTAGKLTRRN